MTIIKENFENADIKRAIGAWGVKDTMSQHPIDYMLRYLNAPAPVIEDNKTADICRRILLDFGRQLLENGNESQGINALVALWIQLQPSYLQNECQNLRESCFISILSLFNQKFPAQMKPTECEINRTTFFEMVTKLRDYRVETDKEHIKKRLASRIHPVSQGTQIEGINHMMKGMENMLTLLDIQRNIPFLRAISNFGSAEIEHGSIEFSIGWDQGPRKPPIEDTYVVEEITINETAFQIAGVFDGHGGDTCAVFLREHAVSILGDFLKDCSTFVEDEMWNAVKLAFVKCHETFVIYENSLQDVLKKKSGATALVSIIVNDCLFVANLGDSRAVGRKKEANEILQMSNDQTAMSKMTQIRKRGGFVDIQKRVTFVPCVSGTRILVPGATIGDTAFSVPRRPEMRMTRIKAGDEFVLGTDGLWDVFGSSEVFDVLDKLPLEQRTGCLLTRAALKRNTQDNVTVIIIRKKQDG